MATQSASAVRQLRASLRDRRQQRGKSQLARRSVTKIGFIGAGNVTRMFGRHLINAGHTIVVSNSRGPETLVGCPTGNVSIAMGI
jgi:hypothetical protein